MIYQIRTQYFRSLCLFKWFTRRKFWVDMIFNLSKQLVGKVFYILCCNIFYVSGDVSTLDPDKYIRIIYIIFYFRILGICRNVDMFGYFLFHPCKRLILVIQPDTTMDFRGCTWWVYTAWKQSVVINSNFRNGFQYRVFQFLWIDRY